jgi:hypothetical protein
MVMLLLDYGADVELPMQKIDNVQLENVNSPTSDPRDENYISSTKQVKVIKTPLHLAIEKNHIEAAVALLARGAKLETPAKIGDTVVKSLDLCKGEEMRRALVEGWNTKVHKYYPEDKKKTVKTILLCAKKLKWVLSKDVLLLLCNKSV